MMLNLKAIVPFALTLTATAAGLTPIAYAGPQQNDEHQIKYSQAELVTLKKAEAVLMRIHETANDVCWQELGPERHLKKLKVDRCLRDVTQDFVDQIDDINLYTAHETVPTPKRLKRNKPKTQLALTEIDIN